MTIELALYSEFLETVPDATVLVSKGGRIVHANAMVGRLLGFEPAALRDQPLSMLIPPSMRRRHESFVDRYFDDHAERPMGSGRQFDALRADGTVLPTDIMLKPVAVSGQPMMLAVMRDLTAWRRLESDLHAAVERERRLAHTDALTGAANRRHFVDVAQREIERSQRYGHAFTLAYIDLDNFKTVNDRWGHSRGDELLQVLVHAMSAHLRHTDLLARLGGDEFALLLPETDAEGALTTVHKLRDNAVTAMQQRDWPVTLSVGLLTCRRIPADVDDLVRAADALMYRAKSGGKNLLARGEFEPPQSRAADRGP